VARIRDLLTPYFRWFMQARSPKPFGRRAVASDIAWTDSERAEIRRLEKVCDASEHWTLECSQTDTGDPWCGQYVVVWPREQQSAKTAIMALALAIDMALEGLELQKRRA
jgi:hypothetical protein